jgi:tetratricopeptide (TPR) repeat protein
MVAVDTARVIELYVPAVSGGGNVGSGYRVSPGLALTAAHVVAALPVWRTDEPVPADTDAPGVCWVRPLGERGWVPAVVAWRDEDKDVAVLRLAPAAPPLPAGSPPPRWGRVEGVEPIAVSAVGFPWGQERADRVRDSEQLFGFIAPATTAKAGLCAVTALTAAPAARAGGSPWAGMSGAALFAGPFLVGLVVVDPARFGADRLVAASVAPLLRDAELAGMLGTSAERVAVVGLRSRLAVTNETSVALVPPYRAPTPRMGREPARLLLPEYGIVPFADRAADLDVLESWCLTGAAPVLRVVCGSGGSGKTRLAAQTCVRMAGHGWLAGFADPKPPGDQVQLDFERPTLLVVDDADLNVPLLADLIRAVGYWSPDTPPFRLLLLARHTTGWWDTLNQRTDRLAAELADPALMLHDGELTVGDRAEHHARALTAFATFVRDSATSVGHTPALLADPVFANPLLVHMHALLTVSGAQVPVTGEALRERILDAVLDRERGRWKVTFPSSVPTGGARTRHQAVTAGTLLAPPTETATAAAIRVISELAPDAAAGARAAVATWLRELYPGSDPPWAAPLRPDLLAEQLLATCPELSDLVLSGYACIDAPEQLEQLLTELTRAAGRARVHEALEQLLAVHLPGLVAAALDAPSSRLPELLGLALTRCPQPAQAAKLVDLLPQHSTGLAGLAGILARQAVSHRRELAVDQPDASTPDLANALNNLSLRLSDLGWREDAVAAAEEAVSIYRQLAAARPDTFTLGLATVLNNLSLRLSDLGWRERALAVNQEALDIHLQLEAYLQDPFDPGLATTLNNLSSRLSDLGHREDALAMIEAAVSIYRQLAAARPDAFTPVLANAMNNLSSRLAELGRRDDALAAIHEAVSIYRQLAATRPDAFNPDFAGALGNLAAIVAVAGAGRPEDSLPAAQEAVSIYRQLAADRPDAFNPGLARSLTSLTNVLTALARQEDSLPAAREAVSIYRQLAAARPDAFNPGLARSLNGLANVLSALGWHEDALAAIQEAVSIDRQLAAGRPDAFARDIAVSLNNLAVTLARAGQCEEAVTASEESVSIYRQLAAGHSEAFTPGLAAVLIEQGVLLTALGRHHGALSAAREAVDLYRNLDATQLETFGENRLKALRNLETDLRALDLGDEANQVERDVMALTDETP